VTRTATVRTAVADPELVAACVRPDNTAEMTTSVEDGCVVTRVERDDTAGLQSTVDDYVVNLTVATEVAQAADRHNTHQS
jgi:tRNA threonylcarbamoyladenosine modification (KEOPS) complex  Pcc1 subunit